MRHTETNVKINKKPWPLTTIRGLRKRINTNPDFQRPAVWSTSQKQLLIDTILRDYDVPKLYWRLLPGEPKRYDVVDGQQRLRAVWGFFDGEFALPKNAEPVGDLPIAGKRYQDLADGLMIQFDIYALDIVVLEDTDDDEVREMFLRLQNGTSLKAQEKRNAMPGKMREFVRTLTGHALFKNVGFANTRLNHDLVAAQMVCLELGGGPTNIKNSDLNKMYASNEGFESAGKEAKAVKRVMDEMVKVFPEKTPELERYNVISLYCTISELINQYSYSSIQPHLHDWFIDFESRRRHQDELDEDQADAEWVSYREKISHTTDSADSIRARMEFMLRDLLERHPDLPRKDNLRSFTHVQKMTVFRRDKGLCQVRAKCSGEKLTWDNWQCDHRLPWSKGGKTTVENGQVACSSCNASKGDAT